MEEDKAAAYYDELTRKGSGAARFKQGLGFSSTTTTTDDDPPPSRGSALPSSTSFMSNFVKASTPKETDNEVDKKTQLQNIQIKLKKKDPASIDDVPSQRTRVKDRETDRRRSRSRERRRKSDDERERSRRRHRSSSRESRRRRSRERRSRRRSRSRSRSSSPRKWRSSERGRVSGDGDRGRRVVKEGNGAIDYANLIDGYDKMTPAERVKAKMKFQLSQTAEKDTKVGSGSHWERFDFNKDAPVDDNVIEATDDDASLVKHIGQSFRFTSLEAKRESQIENAHDEAMFGVPVPNPFYSSESGQEGESENEKSNKEIKDEAPTSSLLNEKVLRKQQGSWRDRASKKAV